MQQEFREESVELIVWYVPDPPTHVVQVPKAVRRARYERALRARADAVARAAREEERIAKEAARALKPPRRFRPPFVRRPPAQLLR